MISISLCMIVKNEEPRLAACLDSLAGLMDEIVIVDTGSTDRTVEIAGRYTDQVHFFAWTGNFAEARNYAFSLCSKDYIYSADADELLDETNRERFRILKQCMVPEIEIVQMYYCNQLEFGTVYNFDRELRPKLFKRLREFTWIEPIHETVRLEPVVFDSDIEIIHKPEGSHAGRDLAHFERLIREEEPLSDRLFEFYTRELYLCGEKENLEFAIPHLAEYLQQMDGDGVSNVEGANQEVSAEHYLICCSILIRAGRLLGLRDLIMKYSLHAAAAGYCSEMCTELGAYYEETDAQESILWYYNAWHETEALISLQAGTTTPLEGLVRLYRRLGDTENELRYQQILKDNTEQ